MRRREEPTIVEIITAAEPDATEMLARWAEILARRGRERLRAAAEESARDPDSAFTTARQSGSQP